MFFWTPTSTVREKDSLQQTKGALGQSLSQPIQLLVDDWKENCLKTVGSQSTKTITAHFDSLVSFCQKRRPWGKDKHKFCLLSKTNSTLGCIALLRCTQVPYSLLKLSRHKLFAFIAVFLKYCHLYLSRPFKCISHHLTLIFGVLRVEIVAPQIVCILWCLSRSLSQVCETDVVPCVQLCAHCVTQQG